jgi:hypothetical protein
MDPCTDEVLSSALNITEVLPGNMSITYVDYIQWHGKVASREVSVYLRLIQEDP